MKVLIAGLGNPGSRYAATRHNVGWMLADRMAARLGFAWKEAPPFGAVARGKRKDVEVMLLKPGTFMNLSGQAIAPLAAANGIGTGSVLVAADEVQFPVGRIRLSLGGSDGGHNGIASVIESFGGDGFVRLRIGVGIPPKGEMKDYVLSNFREHEEELNRATLEFGANAIEHWIDGGADDRALNATMERFNAKSEQPVHIQSLRQDAESGGDEFKGGDSHEENNDTA